MHGDESSTFHRGIRPSRADAPLSFGFGWIPIEEPRKTGADEFDSGHEGESCCESLELVVAEIGKAVSAENIDGDNIGGVAAGAALAAGSVAALFGAVLSFFGDTATPAAEGGVLGIDDGNDHGAFGNDTFASKNDENVWSKDDHCGEEEGAYGKRERVEVSKPTDRVTMAAPAPAPSIPLAGTDESPRSEGLRRQNEGVPIPQATWGPRVGGVERLNAAAAVDGGASSAGADIGAPGREGERLAGAMGSAGGGFPADQRVLQVSGEADTGWCNSRGQTTVFSVEPRDFSVRCGEGFTCDPKLKGSLGGRRYSVIVSRKEGSTAKKIISVLWYFSVYVVDAHPVGNGRGVSKRHRCITSRYFTVLITDMLIG